MQRVNGCADDAIGLDLFNAEAFVAGAVTKIALTSKDGTAALRKRTSNIKKLKLRMSVSSKNTCQFITLNRNPLLTLFWPRVNEQSVIQFKI